MLCILCPDDDGEETFRAQAVRTRDVDLRRVLLAESARVGMRTTEYIRLAEDGELYRLDVYDCGAIATHMAGIYDRVLVSGRGRPLYNRIKGSAKYARCPMCAQRDVKTLDHYLPKQRYPELSVFPANLVPCCSDCNKAKAEYLARNHAEQIFHPYFDNWGTHRILSAEVTVGHTVNVSFSIDPVAGFPRKSLARARTHFRVLGLAPLYAAGAAVELVESKDIFRKNFTMGPDALRAELRYTAESRQRGNLNSWRAALYWGLAESDDFCEGGFDRI